jgi:charged multivesicular body protein 7
VLQQQQHLRQIRLTLIRSKNRLQSLYSDFPRHESTNPHGYRANLDAWRHALVAAAREGLIPGDAKSGQENDRLLLTTGDTLARALDTTEFGKPVALGRVVVSFTPLGEGRL